MARVDYKNMIRFRDQLVEKHKIFQDMELVPLETYEGMDTRVIWEFKTPMIEGFYKPFLVRGDDKIEKLLIGELHYMKRAIYCSLAITVNDEYDLPLLTCEYDQTAPRVTVTVDFMPAVDMSVHQEYREKYYTALAGLWRQYRPGPGRPFPVTCLTVKLKRKKRDTR
jgi:hypothetical protein